MEVLVLSERWLFAPNQDFAVLTGILNKGYSKVINFGYITQQRIREPATFLEDFQIKPGKRASFLLLLGSETAFETLASETGFARNFNPTVFPLAADSDIPANYAPYFGTPELSRYTIADADFVLTEDIAKRVLSTIAYKTFTEVDIHVDDFVAKDDPAAVEYELTAFTSFLPRAASLLLEYSITHFVQTRQSALFNHLDINRCILHAVVIREHDLVRFYDKYCNFARGDKADDVVSALHSSLSFTLGTAKDFHLAFLRREVAVC